MFMCRFRATNKQENRKKVKLNKLIRLGDAIETIANETDSTIPELVEGLIGICWDEEDAGQLKAYHQQEEQTGE